jgi:hypothetical protein
MARRSLAHAVEGYPTTTKNVILEELHVGTDCVFADAGFIEVSRPTPRRAVMRSALTPCGCRCRRLTVALRGIA